LLKHLVDTSLVRILSLSHVLVDELIFVVTFKINKSDKGEVLKWDLLKNNIDYK